MELLFLGTGSGVPSKHRNVSSLALKLLDELNEIWLFDCGEATQHKILHTTLKPRKINKVFITHMHGDHIYGLPGFLSSRSFQGGEDPLTIYGPKGIKHFVLSTLKLSHTRVSYRLKFVEFTDGDVLIDTDYCTVRVERLNHGVDAYGFRIEEKDKIGSLDAERLVADGVPFGPLFGRLKQGEVVTLEDGREIDGKDYIGPDIKGRTVTILGDTKPTESIYRLAKGADVLVHEATFAHSDKELARSYNHSTNVQAAHQAKSAGVKTLLLNHISSRYLYHDVKALEQGAREVFEETYVMNDLDEYEVLHVEQES